MAPLIVWFFLAIVQGAGLSGQATSTQEECEATRAEVAAHEDTLYIAPACVSMTISPVAAPKEKT